MNYINLNGKIIPAGNAFIAIDNSAFRYGYGIFETMLVKDGAIRLKQYHWERLFAGMKQLHFDIPPKLTAEWLEEEVTRTLKKNRLETLCRARLQIFAGGGELYSAENKQPQFIIECFPLESATLNLNENGLVAGIAKGLNKSMDSLCNLKSCNALIYALAARQAKELQWNDALVCNTNGNIIESAIANVFRVKNGDVYTPPLSEGCVAGVMRRHILASIPGVIEKELTTEDLLAADEVFLTNAIKGIRWVGAIENKKYRNKLAQAINNQCLG